MPIRSNLKQLSISGLRGVAGSLNIVFEKPLSLIYGPNGTGKTSICDAIDFIANGECGSLNDNSLGAAKHKYWPFLGKSSADINVQLALQNGATWHAKVVNNKVSVLCSPPDTKLEVKIWRRKQMMDLILAAPGDRFKVIEPFIDVSEIDASERALKDLQRSIDASLQLASSNLAENLSTLEDQCAIGEGNASDVLSWAKLESEKTKDEFDQVIQKITQTIEKTLSLSSALTLSAQAKGKVEVEKSDFIEVEQTYLQAQENITDNSADILDLLNSANRYFHKHGASEACPLCESTEKVAGLAEKVSASIQLLSSLSVAKNEYNGRKLNIGVFEQNAAQHEQDILIPRTEFINAFHAASLSIKDINQQSEQQCQNYLENLDIEELKFVKAYCEKVKTDLLESKARISSVKAAWKQYQDNLDSVQSNNRLKPTIDRILAIHEEQRKAFIDNILHDIAGEVGRLYETIHPGEGLDKIELQLHPKRRASLDIQSVFGSQQAPPGAFFSNSHLDSLGLCILIALAKREAPEATILVMDDILGSIDEPHVDRIIQLLYLESANFMHTVVTTHYHAWHHKIRRGNLRHADCQLIELSQWNPKTGVALQDSTRNMVEILRDNLINRPREIETIASTAGHLLEQIGDWLTLHYEISIPRRRNGNSLNDYLDSLKDKYVKEFVSEVKQSDGTYIRFELKEALDQLKKIFQIRNIAGAHYNDLASHLPSTDTKEFGDAVLFLAELLICQEHGFPNKPKDGYWSTSGDTIRLYPLKRP